jgi:hypothetical protein
MVQCTLYEAMIHISPGSGRGLERPESLTSEFHPRRQPGAPVAGCAACGDDMSKLLMAAVATSIALGLSSGIAIAADTPAQTAPGEGQIMWERCARVGETDRDSCMTKVTLKDSPAGRQCEELMGRAQRRCMLDFLEVNHPVPGAK